MSRIPTTIASLCLCLVVWSAPVRAGDDDYYLSIPSEGAIYLLDPVTGDLDPWLTGLGIPFYGVWATDGFLYMPDRAFGAVFKIAPDGTATAFTAGGLLASPVTVAQNPVTGELVVSDIFSETVVRLDESGNQTLIHDAVTSGGLISGPGGLAFDPDGILYVANNTGNNVAAIAPNGDISLACDDPLLASPGGLAADGAGNLFVASYDNDNIVRVRLDSGEAEVFADDGFMIRPNDVKLHRAGSLLVTTRNSALVEVDAAGQTTVVKQDTSLGEWDGVAVPADHPPCTGRFLKYGTGTPGTGGVVPELTAVFNPCVGSDAALEFRRFLGGSHGFLIWGIAPSSIPALGGTILVDLFQASSLVSVIYPGSGVGGGGFLLTFTMPDEPSYVGVSIFLQSTAADPGAPFGWSMSNGLEEFIGN